MWYTPKFTERELEVIDELCKGKSVNEITKILYVERSTVRSHLTSIREKLEVNSLHAIVAKVLNEKIENAYSFEIASIKEDDNAQT